MRLEDIMSKYKLQSGTDSLLSTRDLPTIIESASCLPPCDPASCCSSLARAGLRAVLKACLCGCCRASLDSLRWPTEVYSTLAS